VITLIISNDFKQWDKTAENIDHEQFYVNLIVRRIKDGEYPATPYVANGIIRIDKPADKNEGYYGGVLAHESNHLVRDPITFYNYFRGIQEIKRRLDTKDHMENLLANVASDLIIENDLSKNDLLRDYSRKSYEYTIEQMEKHTTDINDKVKEKFPDFKGLDVAKPQGEMMAEFEGIISKWHGFKTRVEPKNFDKVMEIIDSSMDREKKYVALARIFKPLLEKDQKNMPKYMLSMNVKDKDGKEQQINVPITEEEKKWLEKNKKLMPINPGKNDVKETKQKIIGDAKTAEEAKEKLKAFADLVKSHQSMSPTGFVELELDDQELLKDFYNAKAEQILVSIDFPRMPVRRGLEVSTKKWQLQDGLNTMDVRRTIMKRGVNIPTVTTLSPKIIPKFISDIKQTKPMDLIISIDTSGSTGYPSGGMNCQADYEMVLLFAILKMAKKIDQKVGLSLWTTQLYYKIPPVDWKKFDELIKKAIFTKWSSGGTLMQLAMNHAINNPNEFHFVFTDGYVWWDKFDKEELKKQMKKLKGRIHFFLVDKAEYDAFVYACGKDSVTDASDLSKLPRVGLSQWKSVFWKK